MADQRGPLGGRSLHARLAMWMAVSTVFTFAAFAGALYVALRLEEEGDDKRLDIGEVLEAEASAKLVVAVLAAGPVALAAAIGGAMVLSRRALAPLDSVIEGARNITASGLSWRLPQSPRRDELHLLVEELNQLFDRLEAGFAALSRHATDASHELRTPLAVVASELEVALQRPRAVAEWEQTARKCLQEVRRLARLVDSLLALARAEGPSERSQRFDLREQVDLVLANLAEQASRSGLVLTAAAEGGADPAWVLGDPDALASAVRNLVDNAIRYTPAPGQVRVGVTCESSWVSVYVEDTGPGLSNSEREAILHPLGRNASNAGARHPDGHGLGLAIASRIVERHRGTLSVEDRTSGGARFVIRLPGS